MTEGLTPIQKKLFEFQDLKYRDFQAKLIPNVSIETIIGVRTPVLRQIAKEMVKSQNYKEFITALPHKYFDENSLHSLIISQIKDYGECVRLLDEFLPFTDNWATCDIIGPAVFKKHTDELIKEIYRWIDSTETYTIRFGVEMLMSLYLDEKFDNSYPEKVSSIKSDKYYVNMMTAWYFATALAKQYDAVLPYIEKRKLDKWTHNKAIQKSIESYRISDEQKKYLKSLKNK